MAGGVLQSAAPPLGARLSLPGRLRGTTHGRRGRLTATCLPNRGKLRDPHHTGWGDARVSPHGARPWFPLTRPLSTRAIAAGGLACTHARQLMYVARHES